MRRNVRVFGLHVVVASCVVVAVASCGGGERPPPESNVTPAPGSSSGSTPPGTELITGLEEGPEGTGLYFGDKGFVNCGKQAPEKTLVLNNPTNDIINFEAKLTSGDKYYTVNPLKGGVPIRGTAVIKIVPAAIPQTSAITPDLYAGTLELKTSPAQPPTIIRLHQTARGAIITTAVQNPLNFGAVKIGTPTALPITLTNEGNASVTANLSVGMAAYRIDGAQSASVELAPGATVGKDVTLNPTTTGEYADTLSIKYNADAVHCQPPPSSVNLRGQGTATAGVSPGSLNFGQVDCGTSADFQTVTISSTIAMKFTATLGKAETHFTLADSNGVAIPSGGEVSMPAASTFTLRVIPNRIRIPASTAPGAFNDTLTITTDVPGDTPKNVNLQMTARGAIFAFNPTQVVRSGTINQSANDVIALVNSGNAAAPYTLTITNKEGFPPAPAGTFVISPSSGTAQVGTTQATLTTNLPSAFNTTYHGALALSAGTGAVLCADLPPSVPLTAQTGAGTSITVNPLSLNFGLVDCGKTYVDKDNQNAPYQTVTITTVTATTFTPTLGKGGSSPFRLADSGGNTVVQGQPIAITPGTPYVLRVVPLQIPSRPTQGTTFNAFGDELRIESPVDPVKTIPLTQTAQGAMLRFRMCTSGGACPNTGGELAIVGPNGAYTGNQLINEGNLAAPYTLTVTGGSTTDPVSGTAQVSPTTVFTLNKAGPGELSVTVPSGTPLCRDLPPKVPITP
jgi:hypothetical protein